MLQVRILDLDGSLPGQSQLGRFQPSILAARQWGPFLRIAAGFGRFRTFAQAVTDWLDARPAPAVTLVGSGDFHHITLAFLRRLETPFNLLVLDNHPDWMRGLPFLHCGTWLNHAARLPHLQRVFHLGGDVDFDNSWRWLAPWRLLREGKIVTWAAARRYRSGRWPSVVQQTLRPAPDERLDRDRLESLLAPYRLELARYPLYISVDKDVILSAQSVVNWDSGQLNLDEVVTIIATFRDAAIKGLVGADIVGDWSPVVTRGLFRRALHWTEHPRVRVNPAGAQRVNEQVNLVLLTALGAAAPDTQVIHRRRVA